MRRTNPFCLFGAGVIAVLLVLVGLACGSPEEQEATVRLYGTMQAMPKIERGVYVRDPRTDLCFFVCDGAYRSATLTHVPCTAKVMERININARLLHSEGNGEEGGMTEYEAWTWLGKRGPQ